MQVDRRRFIQSGVAAAAALSAVRPRSCAPAVLDRMRVCNTRYYGAGVRLASVAPGEPLEVRFPFDPAWRNRASAAFWRGGERVGDAPRVQREMLGRMLRAGCRLDAVVDSVTTSPDGGEVAVRAAVRLLHGERLATQPLEIDEGFMERQACSALEPLMRQSGAPAARPPVFLEVGAIHGASASDAAPGDVLRVEALDGADGEERLGVGRIDGSRRGTYSLYSGRFLARTARAGVALGAIALPPVSTNETLWAATYLLE